MAADHTQVFDYAEELIAAPKAHVPLELRQDEEGLQLLHQDRPLVRCSLSREGMLSAGFMAKALGARVPPLGTSVEVKVSTGVLFRAVSISSLDLANEDSLPLLERWLQEAQQQRTGSSDA